MPIIRIPPARVLKNEEIEAIEKRALGGNQITRQDLLNLIHQICILNQISNGLSAEIMALDPAVDAAAMGKKWDVYARKAISEINAELFKIAEKGAERGN